MLLRKNSTYSWLLILLIQTARSEPDATILKYTATTSHADNSNLSGLASVFSPRMDFDQWKPLTGRGDPLRNDPTYDYEPPVLERVHYWADDSRLEREKVPDRKSEVLVLGVSSRKPSVVPRQPTPPRRHPRPPSFPPKYEDYSYNLSDNFPMTILVPPPPPPPRHKPSLFILTEDKVSVPTLPTKLTIATPPIITRDTTVMPELITSYALQEANLIYQASTTKQNWYHDYNRTTNLLNNTVSSDYAGWGPTTPFENVNDTHNLISHSDFNVDIIRQPLSYYKPVLSEAPPPPKATSNTFILSSFLPTALPPTLSTLSDHPKEIFFETTTIAQDLIETTTEKVISEAFDTSQNSVPKPKPSVIDMLGSMMSMPMVTDPERPEDNLYAHASDNVHIFKNPPTTDTVNLEIMQTMQPPPPVKFSQENTLGSNEHLGVKVNPNVLNNLLQQQAAVPTHDPYLHLRYTTPMAPTFAESQDIRSTTEAQSLPAYLIIQGHSKVKTYGSKPKSGSGTTTNNIPNPNETTEVKHLHPIKDKYAKKSNKNETKREGRAQNLKSLIDNGLGSIEIQEADLGIKYDVSDGSNVPIEIYRKGIVDSDENNYSKKQSVSQSENRNKRQIDLKKIISFDAESVENFVYNIIESKKNDSGVTGLIAHAVFGDTDAPTLDSIEDESGEDDDR